MINKFKPKVILIQEIMQRYRTPIYKLMQNEVDLTLAYTDKCDIEDSELKIIQLPHFKLGPFHIHTDVYKILNNYDVVILQPHLNSISLNRIAFFPRKFKLVTWTIGVHATYNEPYDLSKKPSLKDWCYEIIQDRADSCIFYMPDPIEYWKKFMKIDTKKYFVAHNTVEIAHYEKLPAYIERNSFLFVGTLYKQKGIRELIEAYSIAKKRCSELPILNIVGNGPERNIIEKDISDLGLENYIILCGAIYDENVLKDYFLNALLCVSPTQAGLSVPKSLGYGCPFITHPDAITGGERENIKNGFNGIFYTTVNELAEILIDSVMNPTKYEKLSFNAYNYYRAECTPQRMADGALEAIRYALKRK